MLKRVLGAMVAVGVCLLGCTAEEAASDAAPQVEDDTIGERWKSVPGSNWYINANAPTWGTSSLTATVTVSKDQPYCTIPGDRRSCVYPENQRAYGGGTIVRDMGIACAADNDAACGANGSTTPRGPYKYCLAQDGSTAKTCHLAVGTTVRGLTWTNSTSFGGLSNTTGCGAYRTLGVQSVVNGGCATAALQQNPNSCARSVSPTTSWCAPTMGGGGNGGDTGGDGDLGPIQ